MSHELPDQFLAEIHVPREGRKLRNLGIAALCVAIIVSLIVAVPSYLRTQRETVCRARITSVAGALTNAIILDFTDLTLARLSQRDSSAAQGSLDGHQRMATMLKPIQVGAVDLCHKDPDYRLPQEVHP